MIVVLKARRILLLVQIGIALLPWNDQLEGLNVINQAGFRLDPFRLPLVSTYVFDNAHALEGDVWDALSRTAYSTPALILDFSTKCLPEDRALNGYLRQDRENSAIVASFE